MCRTTCYGYVVLLFGWVFVIGWVVAAAGMGGLILAGILLERRREHARDDTSARARWEAYESTCHRFRCAGHDPTILRPPDVPDPRPGRHV